MGRLVLKVYIKFATNALTSTQYIFNHITWWLKNEKIIQLIAKTYIFQLVCFCFGLPQMPIMKVSTSVRKSESHVDSQGERFLHGWTTDEIQLNKF